MGARSTAFLVMPSCGRSWIRLRPASSSTPSGPITPYPGIPARKTPCSNHWSRRSVVLPNGIHQAQRADQRDQLSRAEHFHLRERKSGKFISTSAGGQSDEAPLHGVRGSAPGAIRSSSAASSSQRRGAAAWSETCRGLWPAHAPASTRCHRRPAISSIRPASRTGPAPIPAPSATRPM